MIGPAVTALAAAGPAAPEAGPLGRGPPWGPVPGWAAFGSAVAPVAADAVAEAVDDDAVADDEVVVPGFVSNLSDPALSASGLAPGGWAAGPDVGFRPSVPGPGLTPSGRASLVPGLADTTGSVAGLGGVPSGDPCGPFTVSAGPETLGFAPAAVDAEDVEADTEAVDADVAGDRDAPPGGRDDPGLPGAASGFRPPGPGLSASLGGGVTGKSSNSSASPRPPSTAAAPGARARYGGPASLSPHG
ncbi:hypothetical protein [Methylobacterium phyllosphaerae]|uniref:hypothetical protein n=1 Tax=Methylobacterium phyllosphaerae TaxID=418223 RepID=UPI001F443CC9|nr:hypothetical protein [Methylobacterium phyllosphaerae]